VDLAQHRHARHDVLDDVEKQHGVEARVAEGKRSRHVARKDAGLGEAPRVDLARGMLELRRVAVEADDPAAAHGRAQEMRPVAGADVQDAVVDAQIGQIPVVPRLLDQVLGVDRVARLAGQLRQAYGDRLAATVDQVDTPHRQALDGIQRRPPRYAASVSS
jgi:hypothetical protein